MNLRSNPGICWTDCKKTRKTSAKSVGVHTKIRTQLPNEYKSEILLFEPICSVTDVPNDCCMTSSFHHGVNEVFVLLGCYGASIGT
jgi:hypothetical protein